MMKTKLKVLLVDRSAAISNGLLDEYGELSRFAEIMYASAAEEAFDEIFSRDPDVVVWGIEITGQDALQLADIRRQNKALTLIIVSAPTKQHSRNTAGYKDADAFLSNEELKSLPKVILQLTCSKPIRSTFPGYSRTHSHKFLSDPLF